VTSIPEWYGHSLYSPIGANANLNDIWGFDTTPQPIKKTTSSPTNEDKLSPGNSGVPLIAPPRSKDQKSPRSDKKRPKSPSPSPGSMFSFTVHFADGGEVPETPMAKSKSEPAKEDEKAFDFEDKWVDPPSEETEQTKKPTSPEKKTPMTNQATQKRKVQKKQMKQEQKNQKKNQRHEQMRLQK